jgi:hypothetical protein
VGYDDGDPAAVKRMRAAEQHYLNIFSEASDTDRSLERPVNPRGGAPK